MKIHSRFLLLLVPLTLSWAHAAPFKIVEREHCNEIQLSEETEDSHWRSQSSGSSSIKYEYNGLKQNLLTDVQFGRGSITIELQGKNVVGESIGNEFFGTEVQALRMNGAVVGKFLGLTDANRQTGRFPDPSAQFKTRERLLLAVLFAQTNLGLVSLNQPCRYVSGEVDLTAIDRGECLWIDQASRAPNDKPYCW